LTFGAALPAALPPALFQEDTNHPMPRTRQQNVTAAQWSANGAALGALDLTSPDNQVFGANVFSAAVQRSRLPKHVYKALQRTLARGEALDTTLADSVAQAMKEWAMEKGATHYRRDPLHALVPAADRLDGGEARLVLRARR
jgi:glutamine synthetase type III